MEWSRTVAISACEAYDEEQISCILRSHFEAIGYNRTFFEGKKVVIKPNLVMKKSPDAAATTHPAVLCAMLLILQEYGVTPVIAESPGGIYNKQRLESIYRVCGIADAAARYGAVLNFDTSVAQMPNPNGKKVKMFRVIEPVAEADILIDLC